jgi:hypothetical protein
VLVLLEPHDFARSCFETAGLALTGRLPLQGRLPYYGLLRMGHDGPSRSGAHSIGVWSVLTKVPLIPHLTKG